jgi:leucyl/phenylalanyl-tRNA--protein transferase
MPVYRLSKDLVFPNPRLADETGLLAVGGDLSPERLLLAYYNGIFPWFSKGDPILWWSPDPRMILYPEKFKVSHSLKQLLKNGKYQVRYDTAFSDVITHCAAVTRKDQEGTWITPKMKNAYIRLHELGFAHSVETWFQNELIGGLYGISIGKAFFGESMFHLARDASKFATFHLVELAKTLDFHFIDAQQETQHLKSLGAEAIPRESFLKSLENAMEFESFRGLWTAFANDIPGKI